MARLARAVVAVLALLPAAWARFGASPAAPRHCQPEGRGRPPLHWIGCRADRGPARPLSGRELLLLGRPVDLNAATADDLAAVPGLSPRLGAAIVEDRARRGPFGDPGELRRVRGIGGVRLERARPFLRAAVR